MDSKDQEKPKRRPLIVNHHQKRSLNNWVVPLIIILAIMVFLPRLIAMLD